MRMTTRPPRRRSIRSSHRSRNKSVLQMASGYVAAWDLVWVPYFLVTFSPSPNETRIITGIFSALQGLLNFIVFINPKVRDAKMKGRRRGQQTKTSNVSWWWSKAAFSTYREESYLMVVLHIISRGASLVILLKTFKIPAWSI